MRKKSHILVARYLADQMPSNESLQAHRKAFCLGSILPDIQPSFITKRHEYFGTFAEVQGKMQRLVEMDTQEKKERVFWRRIGEILHYIADYFTFPHNKTFDGSFSEHNHYEKHLKNQLKDYITSGQVKELGQRPIAFKSFESLVDFIRIRHTEYLKRKRNIEEDIRYILTMCFQVFYGLFQLCFGIVNFRESQLLSA